jgi:hypothetical protein
MVKVHRAGIIINFPLGKLAGQDAVSRLHEPIVEKGF